MPTSVAGDDAISFKPIARATAGWSSGSNEDDQITFKGVTFDAVDLGGTLGFANKMNIKIHTVFNDKDFKFKDAYLEVPAGDVKIRFGNSKVPNFFNWQISGTSKNFLERPTLRRAFGGARKFGVRAASYGENWGWAAGVFKGSLNDTVASSDWTIAARGYLGLSSGNTNWFMGASARYRSNEPDALRYGDRPYAPAAGKLFEYSGSTSDGLLAGELAFQQGAFYGVVEAAALRASSALEIGRSDTLFSGYAEIGYNLTGEPATFDFKRGALGKTEIGTSVTSGGPGLWQIAARYDVLNLSAGNAALGTLNGGLQKAAIFALNWQPNNHIRVLVNFSTARISRIFGNNDRVNAFGMRLFLML